MENDWNGKRLDAGGRLSYNVSMPYNVAAVHNTLIADRINASVFAVKGNREIFLVGGFIRDLCLGRKCNDRDFVIMGEDPSFLEHTAAHLQGKIIRIGKRNLYRMLLSDDTVLDFTFVRDGIGDDLAKRDFTINAMAWSPQRGLIDMFHGMDDLERGVIRNIHVSNIEEDPVRIIRAYRLAREMDFRVEDATVENMKAHSGMLKAVKTERITLEFFKILNLADSIWALKQMNGDGILQEIIISNYDMLASKLNVLHDIMKEIGEISFNNLLHPSDIIAQGLTYKGLIQMEKLVEGGVHCRLTTGGKITRRLNILSKLRLQYPSAALADLYNIFRLGGEAAQDFLILNGLLGHLKDLLRFINIQHKCILSADEIIAITGIQEGRSLGEAIESVRHAEFYGLIERKIDAVSMVQKKFGIA